MDNLILLILLIINIYAAIIIKNNRYLNKRKMQKLNLEIEYLKSNKGKCLNTHLLEILKANKINLLSEDCLNITVMKQNEELDDVPIVNYGVKINDTFIPLIKEGDAGIEDDINRFRRRYNYQFAIYIADYISNLYLSKYKPEFSQNNLKKYYISYNYFINELFIPKGFIKITEEREVKSSI